MDCVDWPKAPRGDPSGGSRDRAIGGYERNNAKHVQNVRLIDLLDTTGDTETPCDLRNGAPRRPRRRR